MKKTIEIKFYSPLEEKINILTHGLGALASIFATLFLVLKAIEVNDVLRLISFIIYGVSMFTLFLASTLYHSSKVVTRRKKLKIFDHAAIYLMIAGTYTPFCLVTLNGPTGWLLFGISWSLAIVGITLKLFFTGRFTLVSTITYLVMGWLILFAYKPLGENLSKDGLIWLIAGGVAFTFGAILYAVPKIKYNHAIFHCCGLVGSSCHFTSIYLYV